MKKLIPVLIILLLAFSLVGATRSEFNSALSENYGFFSFLFSAYGDKQCCNACMPNSGGYVAKGDSKTIDCGVAAGKALIDIYRSTDGGKTYPPNKEVWNPYTLGNSQYDYRYECYVCKIEAQPNSGNPSLTPCVNDAACKPFGQAYICDGGYCHQDCSATNTGSWGNCVNNVQSRTITRPSYCNPPSEVQTQACGTTPTAPSPSTPETPAGTNNGTAKFDVSITDSPTSADTQSKATMTVHIINKGDVGTERVEAGIYKKTTIASWNLPPQLLALFSATPIANCNVAEPNLQTQTVTLNAGEETDLTFTFTVPDACDLTSKPNNDFTFFVDAADHCFDGQTSGLTDWDLKDLTINTKILGCTETCSDGIRNQDESDTDCGGSCARCNAGYICGKQTDCAGNLACSNNRCTISGITACTEPITPKDREQGVLSTLISPLPNLVGMIGEIQKGTYCAKSYTKEDFAKLNDDSIVMAECKDVRNCNRQTGYEVSCANADTVGIKLPSEGALKIITEWIGGSEQPGLCLLTPEEQKDQPASSFGFLTETAFLGLQWWMVIVGVIVGGFLVIVLFAGGSKK